MPFYTQLAEAGLTFIRSIIDYSNQKHLQSEADSKENTEKVTGLRRITKELSPRQSIAHIINHRAGNCSEQCALFMHWIDCILNPEAVTVKLKHVRAGELIDHMVIIIGRKQDSDINDLFTWGDKFVIIDPLFNSYFTSNNLHEFQLPLHWYSITSSGYELKLYDPEKHTFSHAYNLDDYILNKIPLQYGAMPYQSITT